MEVIILESAAYRQLKKDLFEELRYFLNEWKKTLPGTTADEIVWLSPHAARQLIGLKSRNAMKRLRESSEIHYAKIGREFRYDRKSLLDYITKKSTLKYKITTGRRKQQTI